MQDKSNFIRIKRKSFLFALFVLILAIATPVLADYLGPDRATTTSEVDTYDYGVWARDNNKAPYCLDKNGNKADDCIVCEWKRKPGNACGDATYSYTLGTKSEVVEKTINLDPATISSSLQNCNSNNGWCNTLPTLTLNGSEPLSGYNILAVEGSLNGQAFACSGSACDVPLNEGNNDFTFWALSSYGDSSQMGTLFAKVDTVSPNVGLDVVGSNGTSNWYVSSTTITATGSDSTSGLSSVLLSVNGGAWTASTTLNDGVYLVEVRAEDNAGNVSTSSTTISVDAVTPSISLNVNGTMGGNGWYSSNMQVTASASDLTSGIASLEVSTDGGVYQAYTSPVSLTDGYHTIRFKATDNAGNQTETPIQEFYVDAMAPEIDIPSSWEVNKTIGYNIQDDGSGLAALRIVIEDEDEKYKKIAWDEEVSGGKFKGEITWNGKFKDGTVAPPGEYLVWIKAKDMAGNERFGLGRVVVPQPTVFSLLQPTTTNNQETLLPPQELFDGDELPITNPSATTTPQQNLSFGESITDPKESTQTSLSLANGTASASTTTNSNILWSATAAALIGWATATALEEKKKRKEQEAKKLQEDYAKAAKLNAMEEQRKINGWLEGQAMLNGYIEEAKKQGATEEEIAELRGQGATQGLGTAIGSASNLYQNLAARNAARNARIEAKMIQVEAEEDERWEVSQTEKLKREYDDAFSNAGLFFTGYHLQGDTPPTPMPDGFEVVIDPSKRTIYGPPDLYDIFFRQDIKNDDPRQYGNLSAFIPGFGYSTRQTNLCGQIVVAALTGKPLEDILLNYSQEGTGAERLRNNTATRPDEIARLINSQPGWSAQIKGLDGNYWIGGPSSSPSLSEINQYLDDGKKVIALVKIDSNEKNYGPLRFNGQTGHWVSIQDVALSNQKIQIYNPFNDQEQIYNWENFKDAWEDEGSHTIYNYVAIVANPPVISTSPVYPTSTPILTPSTVPSPQPFPTSTQTVTPSQQSEPSIWEKIWNWFKGLGGK